jgi:ABC-2 type transport system permease protein
VLGPLGLALFGLWPRGFGFTWAAYAVTTFIAFLGPGLKLAKWVLDLAPTTQIGNPPLGTVDAGNLATLTIIAIALALLGFIAFRRRDLHGPDQRIRPGQPLIGHNRANREGRNKRWEDR